MDPRADNQQSKVLPSLIPRKLSTFSSLISLVNRGPLSFLRHFNNQNKEKLKGAVNENSMTFPKLHENVLIFVK